MAATDEGSVPLLTGSSLHQTETISQHEGNSQTAEDFINSQLQLEADAREALPYQFDTCTRPLGPLRQSLFSCLTCNPPASQPSAAYTPAGVCYSCSISCHGEHSLVELFSRRNFVCDCGTSTLPSTSPCSLRLNDETGLKGGVHSEAPTVGNKYNYNFQNRFCGCGEDYNPHEEKGTMFQCLGLGTVEEGGCGEDWWHPECIMGLGRDWYKTDRRKAVEHKPKAGTPTVLGEHASSLPLIEAEVPLPTTVADIMDPNGTGETADEEPPLPPGFPHEDDFDAFVCYKCTDAFPWIKRYAGMVGFLPAVAHRTSGVRSDDLSEPLRNGGPTYGEAQTTKDSASRKRKPEEDDVEQPTLKRQKSEDLLSPTDFQSSSSEVKAVPENLPQHLHPQTAASGNRCSTLPPPPPHSISLFLKPNFRDHLCRCPTCFPLLSQHPQLLEEEEAYEPPISDDGGAANGTGSIGTASLLDRGEAALTNVDRVRAIEGVMVYNNLRDKVKSFLQPFAESGQAVGAEDIKAYFEKLRGDAEAIRAAGSKGSGGDGADGGDNRREQSGY